MTSSVGARPVLLSSGDVGGLSKIAGLVGALEDEEGSNGTGMTGCVEGEGSYDVEALIHDLYKWTGLTPLLNEQSSLLEGPVPHYVSFCADPMKQEHCGR